MTKVDSGSSGLGASRPIAPSRSAVSVGGFSASGGMSAKASYNRNMASIGSAARDSYRRTQGAMERGDITAAEGTRKNNITKFRYDLAKKKLSAKKVPISGPKTAMQDRVDSAFGANHMPIGFEYRK